MKSEDWYNTHKIAETVLVAPPGCGKTEGIARWVTKLIETNDLKRSHSVLALTFSRKARANLASRFQKHLGFRWWKWITLRNFHSWARDLYWYHCTWIEQPPRNLVVPKFEIYKKVKEICNIIGCEESEFQKVMRECKLGPFTDEQVITNLNNCTLPEAVQYERWLQASGKIDFDDQLRLGLLILDNPRVLSLYRNMFELVVVDEVQDLSSAHFDLAAPIGLGKTLWAGDAEQGIYKFAGAAPEILFEKIGDRNPINIRNELPDASFISYRSTLAVLQIANTLRKEIAKRKNIDTKKVQDIQPSNPHNIGKLSSLHSPDDSQEAEWIVREVKKMMQAEPLLSIAAIARSNNRLTSLEKEAQRKDLKPILWSIEAYDPQITTLIVRNLSLISRTSCIENDIDILYGKCLEDEDINEITVSDFDPIDELNEIFCEISELALKNNALEDIVEKIHMAARHEEPITPGLHLLTGHIGKGHEFDKVIIVGLEEGYLPNYWATTPEELTTELSTLYVMATRAREELIVTVCEKVKGSFKEPSQWLNLIEKHIENVIRI